MQAEAVITHTLASLGIRSDYYSHKDIATAIIKALGRAGLSVGLDEAQLLEKGEKLFKPVRSA